MPPCSCGHPRTCQQQRNATCARTRACCTHARSRRGIEQRARSELRCAIDHPYQIADLAVTVAVLQCKNSAERHSGNGRSKSHNTADYLDIAVVVVARRHRCPRLRLRRRRPPRIRPRRRPCRPRLRNLNTQQQQQRAESRRALLPSALPSCAANVAAVADADGAAKWRADAAADGRAFVTLVSAADAAAECCLISDQLIKLFAVISGYDDADTSRIL